MTDCRENSLASTRLTCHSVHVSADLSASPYLTRLAARHSPGDPDALIEEAKQAPDPHTLLDLKARFALGWAEASLSGTDFATLADWQTRFAEATINAALSLAWADISKALKINAPLTGLFVLGLGKLGGRDLNVSSDVDLIAYYDAATFPVPEHRGQAYEAGRILKRMHAILQPRNEVDFVWRVDWRLRPEASVRGLAMEVESARDFYFFRALPWHRLALIKARPVAGDLEAGHDFLDTLSPFLWRRNLDYRALDELAAIKARINDEHPGLKAERARPDPITDDPVGFNVKLGTGGIREIEFIANAAQMIWGGKQGELRVPNTLQALKKLAGLGHMKMPTVERLCAIYQRLRRLENAVQLYGNEHTHLIPKGEALDAVKALSGDRLDTLSDDRQFVSERFTSLFASDASPDVELPPFVTHLDGENRVIAESWQSGFGRYGVRGTRGISPLAPELFWRISGSGLEPSEAIPRIDSFFASLARSEQYIRLLAEHPELLDPLLTPLLHSPHMALLLDQSPHIIDVFITPEDSLDTEFIFANPDFETRLESLRRFVNEHLYLNYYELMAGRITSSDMQVRLTQLAEAALQGALRITADDLGEAELPIAIIGLGKIGTRRLMPLSDLDLLFLFPDGVDPALSSAIVRRLRTVLTAKMSEGIVYELDMRLRPSGRAGPPAVVWSAFVDHHKNRARNWEHLALSSARAVAGNRELGQQAESFIADTLARPRDHEQLKGDCARMWARISKQRLRDRPATTFDARLRHGGLLEVEFLSNSRRLMGQPIDELSPAEDYFSDQLIWERLLALTGQEHVSKRFVDQVPVGRTGLLAQQVQAVTQQTFAKADTSGEDQAILWT